MGQYRSRGCDHLCWGVFLHLIGGLITVRKTEYPTRTLSNGVDSVRERDAWVDTGWIWTIRASGRASLLGERGPDPRKLDHAKGRRLAVERSTLRHLSIPSRCCSYLNVEMIA